MRLTIYTDYTLRTLIFLALRPERLTTIAELAEAARAFLAVLDRYTLADLIAPRLTLQRALGIAPPERGAATTPASSGKPHRRARSGG